MSSALKLLSEITSVSESNEIPKGLTPFQEARVKLGLPYSGPQPAAIAVSVHENGFRGYSQRKRYAASLPQEIDISSPKKIDAINGRVRDELMAVIANSGATKLVVNSCIVPAIDCHGKSLNGPIVSRFFMLEPNCQPDDSQGNGVRDRLLNRHRPVGLSKALSRA